METLDGDRLKQQQLLRQKLAEKRRMREEALKKKHGTEMAKEVLEQKKELKDAERNAVGFFHFIFFYTSAADYWLLQWKFIFLLSTQRPSNVIFQNPLSARFSCLSVSAT